MSTPVPQNDKDKVQPTGGVTVWSDADLERLAVIDDDVLAEAIRDARRRFPELAALLEAKPYTGQGDDDGPSA